MAAWIAAVSSVSPSLNQQVISSTAVAPYDICVVCLAPGFQVTKNNRAANTQEQWDRAVGLVPMRRAGLPDEIGATLAFLATAEAGYITGITLAQDGGFSMH